MLPDESADDLTICVKATLTMSPTLETGVMHFKFSDTIVRVTDEENGAPLGYIAGCLGGHIELHDEETGCSWTIYSPELWSSFREAIDLKGVDDD